MTLSISAKSTKPQLLAHIVALNAQLLIKGREAQLLREQLALAQSQPALPLGRAAHAAYYMYVAQQRRACRDAGQRVATYKTYAQWSAA